jgi:hypothetical protein
MPINTTPAITPASTGEKLHSIMSCGIINGSMVSSIPSNYGFLVVCIDE